VQQQKTRYGLAFSSFFYLEQSALNTPATHLGLASVTGIHCADFTNEVEEGLINICAGLGRGLKEGTAEVLSSFLTLGSLDLTFRGKIALVTAEDHGDVVGILYTKNLFAEGVDFIEGATRSDSINEKEALASAHVLITHGTVLLLTSGIEDIEKGGLTVDGDLLSVGILDSRIVLINEVVLDKLDCKSGFAHTTTTNNDNLVFGHLLLITKNGITQKTVLYNRTQRSQIKLKSA